MASGVKEQIGRELRPLSVWEELVAVVVLASSVLPLSLALLSWLSGHDWRAALFAVGGGYLVLWSAFRLCDTADE